MFQISRQEFTGRSGSKGVIPALLTLFLKTLKKEELEHFIKAINTRTFFPSKSN